MKPTQIKTRQGHTYLNSRPNFPNGFDDNLKDEILDRLSGKYFPLHGLQRTGMEKSNGEIGVVISFQPPSTAGNLYSSAIF